MSKAYYIGTFIHSLTLTSLEIVEHGTICVSNGIIQSIQRMGKEYSESDSTLPPTTLLEKLGHDDTTTNPPPTIRVIPKNYFLFPGLIDTHIHASQYPNLGIFGKTTLLEWLNKYTFPLEASLTDAVKAKRVYTQCVQRSLQNGTTTAAYYATQSARSTNILADVLISLGQRGFVGRCAMDSDLQPGWYRDGSPESAVADTAACVAYCKEADESGRVRGIITPRFAPSCSREAMSGLGRLLAEGEEDGLLCQTHISENKGEVALVRKLFPECSSYAQVYDVHNLLTPRTVLAHAIYLTEKEIELVKLRQCGVSHCPTSNMALGSGSLWLRRLLDEGVKVGLGTDVSGGYDVNVLEAARMACLVSRGVAEGGKGEGSKISVEEALWLATRGGAQVLGLEGKVGAFEVGMVWDAILVGADEVPVALDCDAAGMFNGVSEKVKKPKIGGKVDFFGWESWEEKVAKWLYSGDDRNVRAVWVGGELVCQK
ncbi:Metallo-dependent hydrolase [Choiromyces venosus 120613-1]|uniref:Probable guanine deaminase n=1 Tax=Choiromyces venosus 120613-1 TaxID=1336337 RepID=A0A3N4JNQ7_9PEZI|nr:Metallo-dependent hydrolase [Choiromyces venosus 120613-1]